MISIIIPTYNSEEYIQETLRSVACQSYKDFELIIIDDGSSDNTIVKIESAINVLQIDNCKIIEQENYGPSVARNRGLKEATRNYIQFFDSDDIMHPQKIELSLMAMQANPTAGGIITDFQRFRKPKHLKQDERYQNDIFLAFRYDGNRYILENGVGSPRILYKRKFLDMVNGFNESLLNNEDHELNFRLLCSGCNYFYYPTTLMYYRQHGSVNRITNSNQRFQNSILASKTILNQIHLLEDVELQEFAREKIADKIAYSGISLIRLGEFEEGEVALSFAKSISNNLTTSNKKWLNILNKVLGIGSLDKVVGVFNKITHKK